MENLSFANSMQALSLMGKGVNVYSQTVFFKNGYGASIVCNPASYGSDKGLFEVAVLKGDAGSSNICYNTPITGDVIGYLDFQGVADVVKKIEALPMADSPALFREQAFVDGYVRVVCNNKGLE